MGDDRKDSGAPLGPRNAADEASKEVLDRDRAKSVARLIEQIDGVEVLLSQSCVNSAVPILRSAFEAVLSLEYILSSPTTYVERSLAWTCGYLHRRIQRHRDCDVTTPSGADRMKILATFFSTAAPLFDSSVPVQRLQSVLDRPQFAALEADFVQRKKQDKRVPDWFSLLGGPANRRELARKLEHEAEYLVLYSDWSDTVHGTNGATYISPGNQPNQLALIALRNPVELAQRAFLAATFMLRGTRLMLRHFRPTESLKEWYLREIQARYQRLREIQVTTVE
jgi:Family of unknown function (DUF5677)